MLGNCYELGVSQDQKHNSGEVSKNYANNQFFKLKFEVQQNGILAKT